jgi:protocadherin Fat 1/2/3
MFLQVYIQIENENDNVPLTAQPVYYPSVPENSPAGAKIIQLDATDDDKDPAQQISYRLVKGNPEGFFAINSTTGTCVCMIVRTYECIIKLSL